MTSVHEDSKKHAQNEHPLCQLWRGWVRQDRKKLPLSLPSLLLVLTNEPLASPNYLAQATASSLSSKPRPQPNIRILPAGSSTKAAGLHIISITASMNPQAALSFTTFVYTLNVHGCEKKLTCLNHSLQSLKVNYYPLAFSEGTEEQKERFLTVILGTLARIVQAH